MRENKKGLQQAQNDFELTKKNQDTEFLRIQNELQNRASDIEDKANRLSDFEATLIKEREETKEWKENCELQKQAVDEERKMLNEYESKLKQKEFILEDRAARDEHFQALLRDVKDAKEKYDLEFEALKWEKSAVETMKQDIESYGRTQRDSSRQLQQQLQEKEMKISDREKDVKRTERLLEQRLMEEGRRLKMPLKTVAPQLNNSNNTSTYSTIKNSQMKRFTSSSSLSVRTKSPPPHRNVIEDKRAGRSLNRPITAPGSRSQSVTDGKRKPNDMAYDTTHTSNEYGVKGYTSHLSDEFSNSLADIDGESRVTQVNNVLDKDHESENPEPQISRALDNTAHASDDNTALIDTNDNSIHEYPKGMQYREEMDNQNDETGESIDQEDNDTVCQDNSQLNQNNEKQNNVSPFQFLKDDVNDYETDYNKENSTKMLHSAKLMQPFKARHPSEDSITLMHRSDSNSKHFHGSFEFNDLSLSNGSESKETPSCDGNCVTQNQAKTNGESDHSQNDTNNSTGYDNEHTTQQPNQSLNNFNNFNLFQKG